MGRRGGIVSIPGRRILTVGWAALAALTATLEAGGLEARGELTCRVWLRPDLSRGSLKAGKLADITVFDRNLLEIPPREILQAEVVRTVVGGKVVFERR